MIPSLRSFYRSVFCSALAVSALCGPIAPMANAEQNATPSYSGYTADQAYQLRKQWDVPGYISANEPGVYSYLNLSEFLPQASVMRAGQVSELPVQNDPTVGEMRVSNAPGAKTLDQFLTPEASPLQGMIVVHKGAVVYERYPGMRANDNHVWMSNAKPVAGLLVAQLAEDRTLRVEDPIETYMPELVGTNWEGIPVIHILNMATGLDLSETAANRKKPGSGIMRLYQAEVGLKNIEGVVKPHNEVLFSFAKLSESGQVFDYSSANTQMLGLLIERVTGQRLSDVISDRIWSRMGAEGDALVALTPTGEPIIHGLITSRLRDMARFGLLFTPSWNIVAAEPVVSKSILEKIRHGGDPAVYYKGEHGEIFSNRLGDKPLHSAYQWDAIFADGDIFKGGLQGQGLYVSPDRDLVIAWFSGGWSTPYTDSIARRIATRLFPVSTP